MLYWDSKSLDLFEDEVFGKASVGAESAVPSSLYSLDKAVLASSLGSRKCLWCRG